MPQAVAHFLLPALIAALFRDHYLKKKEKRSFPLHYVLIAGIGGILPDIDIIAFWVLHFFGFTITEVHRGITHSLLFVVLFMVLGLISTGFKTKELGKRKLKLSTICLLLAFGIFTHISLDAILIGHDIKPLYPFSFISIGLDLFNYLPIALKEIASATLDDILLILWIIYLEIKHKISDFI